MKPSSSGGESVLIFPKMKHRTFRMKLIQKRFLIRDIFQQREEREEA